MFRFDDGKAIRLLMQFGGCKDDQQSVLVAGDFKSALTYLPNTAADDFVTLTMPARTSPESGRTSFLTIFQMNLPKD